MVQANDSLRQFSWLIISTSFCCYDLISLTTFHLNVYLLSVHNCVYTIVGFYKIINFIRTCFMLKMKRRFKYMVCNRWVWLAKFKWMVVISWMHFAIVPCTFLFARSSFDSKNWKQLKELKLLFFAEIEMGTCFRETSILNLREFTFEHVFSIVVLIFRNEFATRNSRNWPSTMPSLPACISRRLSRPIYWYIGKSSLFFECLCL